MKKTLLILLTMFSVVITHACLCHSVSLSREIALADNIFIGTVLRKTTTIEMQYSFSVSQTLKGGHIDTVTVTTGFGGGDCGKYFEIGRQYIVFAVRNKTSGCSRSYLLDSTIDINRIRSIFQIGYLDSLGKTTDPLLSSMEAEYLNFDFVKHRNEFNFHGKKIAFVLDGTQIDKEQFFKLSYDKIVRSTLVKLSIGEKKTKNDYDAVIHAWSQRSVTGLSRKKLLKRLN